MAFLEDFQANIESLPSMLQRYYAVMRDLDSSLQAVQRQNEQRCEQEIEDIKKGIQSGNITSNTSHFRFSDEALDEQKHCIRIADEKVALAVRAYDMVDAHIQQLDDYMRKFDDELRKAEKKDLTSSAGVTSLNLDSNTKSGRASESSKAGRKKTRAVAAAAAAVADAPPNPSMELDLPVDPNEPTYCFCDQVSYGEMVACDNPDARINSFKMFEPSEIVTHWYLHAIIESILSRKLHHQTIAFENFLMSVPFYANNQMEFLRHHFIDADMIFIPRPLPAQRPWLIDFP